MTERSKIEKDFIIETKKTIKENRTIAALTNNQFNISYWDGERVRDVIRKYNKKIKNREINSLLAKFDASREQQTIQVKTGVLDLADLHIPFHIDEIFDIVEKHKKEISTIILSGDILDCFEISRFISINSYAIENELVEAIKIIKQIKEIVGSDVKIILICGNHEKRWQSYIARMHDKKLCKFLNPNVLQMLKTGFTLFENEEEIHYDGISDLIILNSWHVNIQEELIICHPNNFSKTDIKNAKTAIEYFITNGHKFRAVAVSHGHRQQEIFDYLGKYAVEVGCLCKPFDYSDGFTSKRKNTNGYALFKFDNNGRLNINESKLYEIEQEFETDLNVINLW